MEAGVWELRDHLSRYLEAVLEGEEVTVTDHGRAVARLVPLDRPRTLDRLIAEGVVTTRPRQEAPADPYRTTGSVATTPFTSHPLSP